MRSVDLQHNLYWPYIDNIWIRNKPPIKLNAEEIRTAYYWCRFNAKADYHPKKFQLREQNKPSRTAIGCGMKFKALFHNTCDSNTQVEIILHGDCCEHVHDLGYADSSKKNSAFRIIAAEQVSNGYKVSAVSQTLCAVNNPQDRKLLQDAGGRWLNLKDVHNAGAIWKKQNPNEFALKEFDYHGWNNVLMQESS